MTNVDISTISYNLEMGNYRYIGSGSSRRVYSINNNTVLKEAKNKTGYAQNQAEYQIYTRYRSSLFAPILAISPDFHYLIMRKGDPVRHARVIFHYYDVSNYRQLFHLPIFQQMLEHTDLAVEDLRRLSSWGLIHGQPVLIDYGFTKEVRRKYY